MIYFCKNTGDGRHAGPGTQRLWGIIAALCLCCLASVRVSADAASSEVFHAKVTDRTPDELAMRDFMSVCPPFYLRDQTGNIIDPVYDKNTDVPYSPEKTCGQCHDYERIVGAYHFQQGKDEKLLPELAAMYPWMRTPGQYGGRY